MSEEEKAESHLGRFPSAGLYSEKLAISLTHIALREIPLAE
jgi:hypothetical protein